MTSTSCGGGQHKISWVAPALIFGVPLYLYANLFAFPKIPFLLGGDQIFFWVYAQRNVARRTYL